MVLKINLVEVTHSCVYTYILYFILQWIIGHLLFSIIAIGPEMLWSSLGSGSSSSGRLKYMEETDTLLGTQWGLNGLDPYLHSLKVMLIFWTYSKRAGDKGKILGRSVTWFNLRSPKNHSGCCVKNGAGMGRTVKSWSSDLGERWWLPVGKSSVVQHWVPFNQSPSTEFSKALGLWFLTSASRLWPQSPSPNLSPAENLASAPPYTML